MCKILRLFDRFSSSLASSSQWCEFASAVRFDVLTLCGPTDECECWRFPVPLLSFPRSLTAARLSAHTGAHEFRESKKADLRRKNPRGLESNRHRSTVNRDKLRAVLNSCRCVCMFIHPYFTLVAAKLPRRYALMHRSWVYLFIHLMEVKP